MPMVKRGHKTRIMVFGTFDGLHKGHSHFFKQARRLAKNPFLIVSVARDLNVQRIKGRLPLQNEKKRLINLQALQVVDKVVLGGLKSHLAHILKEKPEIIPLGYDQIAYTKNLAKDLRQRGLVLKIVRLKAHKPHKYKISLLRKGHE